MPSVRTAISSVVHSPAVRRTALTVGAAALAAPALTGCGLGHQINAPNAQCDAPLPSHLMLPEDALSLQTTLGVYGTDAQGKTLRFGTIEEDLNWSGQPEVTFKNPCGTQIAHAEEEFRLIGSTVDDIQVYASPNAKTERDFQLRKEGWNSTECAFFGGGHKACSVFDVKETTNKENKEIAVSVKSGTSSGNGAVTFEMRDPKTAALEGLVNRDSNTTLGAFYQIDALAPSTIPVQLLAIDAAMKTVKDNNSNS